MMAVKYLIDLSQNDDLIRIVQKCNHNFKLMASQASKQTTINQAASDTAVYSYIDQLIDNVNDRIDNIPSGGGGEGGDCTCGAYTVVPWTDSSYDEDRHYDDDTQSYVAVHKVSGYKTWEELGFEPMGLATDISGIINGTAPSAPAYSGTVPDLPDDDMCCGTTCVIKVPWTDSPYDENRYYDEDAGYDVALHTLDGFKTFEELGLEPYDYETLVDSLF